MGGGENLGMGSWDATQWNKLWTALQVSMGFLQLNSASF